MGSKRSFGRLRKRDSGRWQASYTGPDGKIHYAPTTYAAKIDAEGWFAAERRLIETDQWAPPVERTQRKFQTGRLCGTTPTNGSRNETSNRRHARTTGSCWMAASCQTLETGH